MRDPPRAKPCHEHVVCPVPSRAPRARGQVALFGRRIHSSVASVPGLRPSLYLRKVARGRVREVEEMLESRVRVMRQRCRTLTSDEVGPTHALLVAVRRPRADGQPILYSFCDRGLRQETTSSRIPHDQQQAPQKKRSSRPGRQHTEAGPRADGKAAQVGRGLDRKPCRHRPEPLEPVLPAQSPTRAATIGKQYSRPSARPTAAAESRTAAAMPRLSRAMSAR